MAITSFKRYEKKFLLTQKQFDRLIPKLLDYMNPDENCKDGEEYSIYNIYYDTNDDSLIRHSVSKPYYKEKLRLRSYNVPSFPKDTVFLELKKKIGGVVNKRRIVITLQEAYDLLNKGIRPNKCDYMTEQVVNEIEYFLSTNEVKPKAYISYRRKAFFGKEDRDFRVTFDTHIITRRDELALEEGCYGEELLKEGQHLMEVKILGGIPVWLTKIFAELGIYTSSFSKYGKEYKKYCNNEDYRREKGIREIC